MAKATLSDTDILVKVDAAVKNTTGWTDSKLSQERERVTDYYNGTAPKRQSRGNSSYVSSDVYDAVEQMKAQLLETFAGGHDILHFEPSGINDVQQAQLETRYVSDVVFNQNPGFSIFHDVIDDGLQARAGVAKVYWQEKYAVDTTDVSDLTEDEALALVAQDDISDLDVTMDEETGLYSGSYQRKIDQSQVVIETVPPEEFYVSQGVKRREDGVRGHRTLKTRAELITMGLDKAKVAKVAWDDANSVELSAARQARLDATGETGLFGRNDAEQPELEQVLLHETYIELALKDDGTSALYRVLHAGGVLFEYQEVDEDPFVVFVPLRRPHAFFGNNFAARCIQTQNARTVLTRAILDHTALTTNPRTGVVQGGLLNPKELLDNRLGGLVNLSRPDALVPIVQQNLNPFVFETLKMLKDNKEENTGISALSQGLNKDAISTQNSQGLVDNLVTLSQTRQKVIARFFAVTFLTPLYLKVWRCVMENDKRDHVIEVAGSYIDVKPSAWIAPHRGIALSLHLGYGEQDKEAAKYAEAYKALSSDPGAAPFFQPTQRHKLLTDAFVKNGIKNAADYIAPLEQAQPPQPDPVEMAKAEALKAQAQATLLTAQTNQAKVQSHATVEQMQAQLAEFKAQLEAMVKSRDAERKDLDTANRINVAQRELALAEAVPPENQRGIFSANS